MAKENLSKAKQNKNDEFYTQLTDIEKELKHYKKHFENKVVYCNCDDPYESNFFKYFALNFNYLKLKKLIAVGYKKSPIAYTELTQLSMFEGEELPKEPTRKERPYCVIITEVKDYDNNDAINLFDIKWLLKNEKNSRKLLKGTGDFRSEECINLLKQADIVVTNPPFSLFREYITQLIEHNKKFLIIGNLNAITYKEMFPLIKDNKVWLGCRTRETDMFFDVSKEFAKILIKTKKEGSGYRIINGEVKARATAIWFTNLDHNKRHEKLILYKTYNSVDYPKYDNYNAIEVNKTINIPMDYDGIMGVPITFLEKYNPEQFEILGMTKTPICYDNNKEAKRIKVYENVIQHNRNGTKSISNVINGGPTLIVKTLPKDTTYYETDAINGYIIVPYARILIKKK